jgi:folate-dependent tRNA-U54 methylase TrmFO/GidA
MKANFGILPDLEKHEKSRAKRKQMYVERALTEMHHALLAMNDSYLVNLAAPVIEF